MNDWYATRRNTSKMDIKLENVLTGNLENDEISPAIVASPPRHHNKLGTLHGTKLAFHPLCTRSWNVRGK